MKKILTALFVCSIATSAFAGTVWHRQVAAAQTEARSKNQLILADMFADWCGWCHRIEREVFPSEQFQNATREIVLLRLDTEDRAEGTRLSRQWGVTSLPTFVMLTPDLEIVGYIQGYAPSGPFSARITELVRTQRRYETLMAKGNRSTPEEKLELSRTLADRRRFSDSETLLNGLIAARPPAALANQARYQLAFVQFEQKKYDASLRGVNALLGSRPDAKTAEDATFLRARIYVEQANFTAALNELQAFRKTYPKSAMLPAVDRVVPQLQRALAAQ